jgi:hypothetical protein
MGIIDRIRESELPYFRKIKSKCKNCKKVFCFAPSRKRIFCSRRCTDEYKKNGKYKICPVCNKRFYKRNAYKNAIYCSFKCYKEYKEKNFNKVIKCHNCNKKIKRQRCKIKTKEVFCSRKCMLKFYFWKGGKSFEPYGIEFNKVLKEEIRKRDKYICQKCRKKQKQLKRKLYIHHIDYNKKNNKPKNLISLCLLCHSKTNFNRNKWKKYFTRKVKNGYC